MLKIKNAKLVKYLTDKEDLVKQGRSVSKEIEKIELKIQEIDKLEREITSKVHPEELLIKGEELKKKIEAEIEELKKIGKEIEDIKIKAIPEDMVKKHYALRDEKEKLETDRNKIALKIQKIKDRVIPIIQKEVKPHLQEFDDIETAIVKNNEVWVTTYNRLEEFKKSFKKA